LAATVTGQLVNAIHDVLVRKSVKEVNLDASDAQVDVVNVEAGSELDQLLRLEIHVAHVERNAVEVVDDRTLGNLPVRR
jgi:hypothetical protein